MYRGYGVRSHTKRDPRKHSLSERPCRCIFVLFVGVVQTAQHCCTARSVQTTPSALRALKPWNIRKTIPLWWFRESKNHYPPYLLQTRIPPRASTWSTCLFCLTQRNPIWCWIRVWRRWRRRAAIRRPLTFLLNTCGVFVWMRGGWWNWGCSQLCW